MDNRIAEKLKKILNKADASKNPSEEEVQTAMKMAQAMAIKHNIDLASIKVDEEESNGIETDRANLASKVGRTRRPHHDPLARVLMDCFQVKFIWLGGSNAAIVGESTDVALAQYCWDWLDPVFPKLYLAYIKGIGLIRTASDNNVRRRSFYEGVESGIKKNNKRAVEELNKDDGNKYALVVIKKEEVVTARYEDEFPDARQSQNRARRIHGGAYSEGRTQGGKIKLGHGLGGGKTKGAIE